MTEHSNTPSENNSEVSSMVSKVEQLSDQKSSEDKKNNSFFRKFRSILSGAFLATGMTMAAGTADANAARMTPPPADSSQTSSRPLPAETPQPAAQTEGEREITQSLEITGTISAVPNSPNKERLHLVYPEGILDGRQPLVKDGETINIFFGIKGDFPITEVVLPLESIFGKELAGDTSVTIDTKLAVSLPGSKLLTAMTNRLEKLGVVLDETSREYMNQLVSISLGNDRGITFINVTVVNKDITLNTIDGSVTFNPAELFISDGSTIIDWRSQYDDASYLPPTELTISDFSIGNVTTGKVETARDITIKAVEPIIVTTDVPTNSTTRLITATPTPLAVTETPAANVTVVTVPAEDTDPTATPIVIRQGQSTVTARVVTPTPTSINSSEHSADASPEPNVTVVVVRPESTPTPIVVNSGLSTENPNENPSNSNNSSSEWNKEWPADESISLRTWWNDMISKRYIYVSDLAIMVGGDELNSYLDSSDLVPNPVDYRNKQKGFKGDCGSELRRLIDRGEGEIIVSQEAFNNIPGGEECQVFAK